MQQPPISDDEAQPQEPANALAGQCERAAFDLWISAAVVLVLMLLGGEVPAAQPVKFDVQFLTVDANEGCDVADVDGDGKLDVIAGRNWFRNGDWLPRPVRVIEDWNGYVESNGEYARDVNHDGRVDVVSGSFQPTAVYWFENPGPEGLKLGQLWQKHLLADTGFGQNEVCFLHDLDGDGTPEWVYNSWNKTFPLLAWKFGTGPREVQVTKGNKTVTETKPMPILTRLTIGENANGHGMGFGDINNDGREDILVGTGWYERPEGDPWQNPWTYHADWDIHASCPMLVRDVNEDGRADLIWGKGHDYGLYLWLGRSGQDAGGKLSGKVTSGATLAESSPLQFEERLIDDSFSQPHVLHFADLDGDGRDELITGKRYRAHNERDPGGLEPPILCYYTWDPAQESFTKTVVNEGQTGIGLQIRTADLDGDGDLEIVAAGKEGTKILWNRRK